MAAMATAAWSGPHGLLRRGGVPQGGHECGAHAAPVAQGREGRGRLAVPMVALPRLVQERRAGGRRPDTTAGRVCVARAAGEGLSGPVELPAVDAAAIDPYSIPEATPLQIAASVVLTGAIAVLVVRALRRRYKLVSENRFRSTGLEALDLTTGAEPTTAVESTAELKAAPAESETARPPSPLSTLGGAIVAGAIAAVMYNFTKGIENTFARQTVAENYSIRNISVAVRTIVQGMGWLATFTFGLNSVGLSLYSGKLLLGLVLPQKTEAASDSRASLDTTGAQQNEQSERDTVNH